MGDMYHHTMATQIANQLGNQALDLNEARLTNWKTTTLLFNQKNNTDQQNEKEDVKTEAEEDIVKVPSVAKVSQIAGRSARAFGVGAYRGMSQGEGAINSIARGGRGMTAELTRGGEQMGAKLFGEGATAVKEMTGIEGIVGKNLLAAGGGEVFAKVAGKSVAGLGLGITAVGDMENFFQTGNIFSSKNDDGTTKEATTGEKIGNVASLVAGGLDVLAAFTGGALAPVAAVANIAAATESTIAQHDADEKEKETDAQDAPTTKPPPTLVAQGFTQLGLQASQSHNPLNHIG